MHKEKQKPFHITSKTSITMLHTPPHNHLGPKRRPKKTHISFQNPMIETSTLKDEYNI
jgi:hypothetical protein